MWRTILSLALLVTVASQASARSPLEPLGFLAGHCWRGQFPDGAVDTHCYTWIYGGKHLRDVHVVRGDGPDYRGETVYSVDGASDDVIFRYWNSLGGVSDGRIGFENGAIVAPGEKYVGEDGTAREFRSSLKRLDEDRYEARTEELVDGQWSEFSRVEFTRAGNATDEGRQQAREVVEGFVSAFSRRDIPALIARVHPDIEWLSVNGSELSVETQGVDALKESLTACFESCSTCRSTVKVSSVNGAYVTAVETATWKSSGATQSQSSTSIYEVVAGEIRRVWYYPAVDQR